MNHNDAFSRCHPLVNFLYFALVLLGAMVLQHPVCQVISLIGAIACFCCLGGEKPGGFRLWYALALFVLTAAVNPAFSHEGRTILRYLPSGNPLTLESVLYGLGAGLTLCTALIWFSDYTRVMTSDKFVYLFGRIVRCVRLVRSPLTKPEKQRLRPESAPRQRRLCALPVEKVENPAQRVVRGDARHGLLRAVQIIQPLGRHIRAQKTLGRLLGELFEIKPQAKARKALVRLDRSR